MPSPLLKACVTIYFSLLSYEMEGGENLKGHSAPRAWLSCTLANHTGSRSSANAGICLVEKLLCARRE